MHKTWMAKCEWCGKMVTGLRYPPKDSDLIICPRCEEEQERHRVASAVDYQKRVDRMRNPLFIDLKG